ncbi:DUF6146 family protein [Chryseobacterium sp. MYb264]|uniref:DUF6146 family protein n=1 Tax=Chryseobacterium sp. MYb264 TaxID=2745153 RepID=UPI002E0D8CDC|nr:DUF6146 family protein [Chryseobacterium sp. MYb264]
MVFITISCKAQSKSRSDKQKSKITPSKNEDKKWDITVIDTQFDYFLNAVAKPMNQYSESYLKTKKYDAGHRVECLFFFRKIQKCHKILH